MKKFKIKSFCKINLSLKVLKKLKSGYHSIHSYITFCNIFDIISINETRGIKDKISFSGEFGRGIKAKSNSVTKVLYLLRKNNIIRNKKFKINIKKNIPHGSGLGGASSNAADLLNFFYLKSKPKIDKNKVIKIAKIIGFDVPICLEKKNTVITGKYDQIFKMLGNVVFLCKNPPLQIFTKGFIFFCRDGW